jgi:1-acyl-sn-glycerol-3-phosphate acyltransferase
MNVNIVYRIVHFLTRTFFKLYGQWELIDYHHLPKTGAVIATPNHISYLDPEMIGSAITRECAFMARHDLWDNKFLAWLLPKLGSFPVNRDKPDRTAIRNALEVLEKALCLVIFPEGTRSKDGKLQAAEAGVALIVQKSGAPVVPIAIIGSNEMLPVGANCLRRAKLKVVFGKPIHFKKGAARDEILRTIMCALARLMNEHGTAPEAIEAQHKPDLEC